MNRIKRMHGWLSGDETPIRCGVYERMDPSDGEDDWQCGMFSYWDGESWGFTQEFAYGNLRRKARFAELYRFPASQYQKWPWRGVVK